MPSALSVFKPAGVAVLLVAAVAATAAVLYAYWPAGIAVGLALGTIAVVAIGARMQLTERLQPADAELAAELGITPATVPVVVTVPAAAAVPIELPEALAPVLHVQPDVLYFTSDEDPDHAEAREVVVESASVESVRAEPSQAEAAPVAPAHVEPMRADPVREDLERLKVELGEDYRDFARAVSLVVSTQYASAARLQRDLDLPYSRARRLLADLEEQHFVGPATGSLPRQVLLPKERLPEVEQLLAEA